MGWSADAGCEARPQKVVQMNTKDTLIATFPDHMAADAAVRALAASGFDVKNISVVGKGYHTEETVAGFYNVGDRMKVWGAKGAFWGGLWGLFFGGVFLAVPVLGHVIVLGYLAAAVASAVEGAVVVGGLSAIGGALSSIGVPNDSVVRYESEIKADSFLVMAHGDAASLANAKASLQDAKPSSMDAFTVA